MTTESQLAEAVRRAWSAIPAPPIEDMQAVTWAWGEAARQAFVNVAPMDVDIASRGFFSATPLLDLPPRAAAAYLGTYLLALLRGLERQRTIGIYSDILSRAHTVTCLELPDFWTEVIRPHLSRECLGAIRDVVEHIIRERALVPLTDAQVETISALARAL